MNSSSRIADWSDVSSTLLITLYAQAIGYPMLSRTQVLAQHREDAT